MKKEHFFEKLSKSYAIIGLSILIIGFSLIFIPNIPQLWYMISPDATNDEIEAITKEITIEDLFEEEEQEPDDNLPPLNTNLPENSYVVINTIGVYSPINMGDDYIQILKEGSWLVSDFGTPTDNTLPIILAAHRFGYTYWDKETRERISFFNLPKTHIGDKISIIWNQREYTYEIYKEDESSYISDYDADLILYTCKYFNSPIRIFRYAKMTY